MTPDTNAHRGSRAPLYTVPTNPGGSKWERNTPPPIGVCYRHSRQSFGVAVRCLTDYLRAGSPRESRPLSSGSRGALLTRSLGYSTQTSTQRSHTHIYARSHARTHASPHTPCCLLSHPTHTIANKSLAGCSISLCPSPNHSFVHPHQSLVHLLESRCRCSQATTFGRNTLSSAPFYWFGLVCSSTIDLRCSRHDTTRRQKRYDTRGDFIALPHSSHTLSPEQPRSQPRHVHPPLQAARSGGIARQSRNTTRR